MKIFGKKMDERGILQIEAMLCFAAFAAILGLFIAAINAGWEGAGPALDSVKARENAESCCIIADAIFAGNAAGLSGMEMPCNASGGTIESIANETSKKCDCLSAEVRLSNSGKKSTVEVKTNGHYLE